MKVDGIVAAFRKFDAKLDNIQWAASAIARDGAIVVSCWQHRLKPLKGNKRKILRYADEWSRWSSNHLGRRRLAEHLQKALDENLSVRLVVVWTDDTSAVDERKNGLNTIKKAFSVKPDLVGRVKKLDEDGYVIDFEK